MRPLTFSDDKNNEQTWLPDNPQSAPDAFREFVGRHRGDDNASFCVKDEENEESLLLLFDAGALCRVKGGENPRTEYRLITSDGAYWSQASSFVRGGFAALGRKSWVPDLASLAHARLVSEFDESVLRRAHPRELRRRLEVLTYGGGRTPITVDGVTHFGFGKPGGDAVNAWFTAEGRGLVVTFDHTSALNSADDARAQAALYDGVPADLLALVKDAPETDTTLNVSHPDGGTLVAATGIFHFSGPCAMADGLLARLQEAELGIEDTGVGRLLGGFLALEDFTPAAVAEAAQWWSAEDIATGFASAAALDQKPFDQDTVDSFCGIWADSGYNDRWDVHYVLFDSCSLEETGDTRDELLSLIQTLGLERVDTPPGAATGEVWVRTDPRIDAELESWA